MLMIITSVEYFVLFDWDFFGITDKMDQLVNIVGGLGTEYTESLVDELVEKRVAYSLFPMGIGNIEHVPQDLFV